MTCIIYSTVCSLVWLIHAKGRNDASFVEFYNMNLGEGVSISLSRWNLLK